MKSYESLINSASAAAMKSLSLSLTAMKAFDVFSSTNAQYWQHNPPTDAEWEQADKELSEHGLKDACLHDQEALKIAFATPEHSRLLLLKCILIALFWLFLSTELFFRATDSKTSPYATRGIIVAAVLASAFFGGHLQKAMDNWGVAKKPWKNRRKAAPIARVISRPGQMVPVYERANSFSTAICWLLPGDLVVLHSLGTKQMKAVVVDVDEHGDLVRFGWVNRRHLKRITLKQSYAIKKVAEQHREIGE